MENELKKLAATIVALIGLDKIQSQIEVAIEDDLLVHYTPYEMEGEDMSIRYYGETCCGEIDLIANGKLVFNDLKKLDAENIYWLEKIADKNLGLRISYIREDVPVQFWTMKVCMPEWPNKEDGNQIAGNLRIEKEFLQPIDNVSLSVLNCNLEVERLKKINAMYSML